MKCINSFRRSSSYDIYVPLALNVESLHRCDYYQILRTVTTTMMRMLGENFWSFVVEMLAKPSQQKSFTKTLIERVLGRDVNDDEGILLEEG